MKINEQLIVGKIQLETHSVSEKERFKSMKKRCKKTQTENDS